MNVLPIAPANVLQGAVRLHGLKSSPTPDTHVRVACACAGAEFSAIAVSTAIVHDRTVDLISISPWRFESRSGAEICGCASDDSIAIVTRDRPRVGPRRALVGRKIRSVVVNEASAVASLQAVRP